VSEADDQTSALSGVGFPRGRLELIRSVERGHFWHEPRRLLLLETVRSLVSPGARILDVGCGTGRFCEALHEAGYASAGADPWIQDLALDEARFRAATAEALPWADGEFDMVCALDVLEHVDDRQALAEMYRVLRPSGVLLVCVPACQWLWSGRDIVAGHRRRYRRRVLRDTLSQAGFSVERLFGYQFILLPLLVLSRMSQLWRTEASQVEHEDRPWPMVNAVLRAINRAEVRFGRLLRPRFGSSLIAVARR
jgi:Methylase involved in ubiquinone/menaquinone biosynthesis